MKLPLFRQLAPSQILLLALAVVLMLIAAFAPAHAGDEGLYGPAAPPNSAFIRIFNATSEGELEGRIADQIISDVPAQGASEFVFLPPGVHSLTVGGRTLAATLEKNRFYTAAVLADGIRLLGVERFGNRRKALILLYNLTGQSGLGLQTADGRAVVEGVAADAVGSREVNAVKVSLDLVQSGKKLTGVRPISLERGKAYSLFVIGSGDQATGIWVVN